MSAPGTTKALPSFNGQQDTCLNMTMEMIEWAELAVFVYSKTYVNVNNTFTDLMVIFNRFSMTLSFYRTFFVESDMKKKNAVL